METRTIYFQQPLNALPIRCGTPKYLPQIYNLIVSTNFQFACSPMALQINCIKTRTIDKLNWHTVEMVFFFFTNIQAFLLCITINNHSCIHVCLGGQHFWSDMAHIAKSIFVPKLWLHCKLITYYQKIPLYNILASGALVNNADNFVLSKSFY